jgi:hypothetical protein
LINDTELFTTHAIVWLVPKIYVFKTIFRIANFKG